MSATRAKSRASWIAALGTCAALAVVAVPASGEVPWYASAVLACALSAGVGLFAWGVGFVSETKRRLSLLERNPAERNDP